MLKSVIIRNLLLSLVVLLVSNKAVSQSKQGIKIGFLNVLTGQFADVGDDCQRGVTIAQQNFTASPIHLTTADSQADGKVGVSEFRKLTEQDKILGLFSIRSSVCLPINPLSKQKHLPFVCTSGHPKFASNNEYVFQAWPSTTQEGETLAKYLKRLNLDSVAILTGEDEWLLSMTEEFSKKYQSNGGSILMSENILPNDFDAKTILTKIRSKNPSALFINLTLSQGAVLIKRARELGLKMPIFSNFFSSDISAMKTAGGSMEGVAFTEAKLDFPKFSAAVAKLANLKRATGMTLSCFVGMSAILQATQQPDIKTSEDLYQALLNLKSIKTLDGEIPVQDRRFIFDVVMKKIQNGKIMEIN